jgi:hypothetical protein
MSETELVTYHGNCHCGAVKFTVTQPKITETSGGTCDCSICTKKGYVWAFPPEGALKFERGEEKLVSYEFGPKTLAHKVISQPDIIQVSHADMFSSVQHAELELWDFAMVLLQEWVSLSMCAARFS